jgi:hypothetical protein
MPAESPENSEPAATHEEQQLCTSCLCPNVPETHFCKNCGAPLSSYAATAPFERLFAQGHAYRQATENPRKPVVVLGIWLLFGPLALTGLVILFLSPDSVQSIFIGGAMFAISLAILVKTTRNYLNRDKSIPKPDPGDEPGNQAS